MTLIIILCACELVLFALNWYEFVERRGKDE